MRPLKSPEAAEVPRLDLLLGITIFGIAGALIGYYLSHAGIAAAGVVLGGVLGLFVARLGARRFFYSVLVWTLVGGVVGWFAGGEQVVPLMAGSGSAIGGFWGITLEMLMRARSGGR